MTIRGLVLTILGLLVVTPAQAERQTYDPRALGPTYYDIERAQAYQQRLEAQSAYGLPVATTQRRYNYNRRISPEEQYQVLSIEKQFKERFPVHPGMYRDAVDRGSWTRSTGSGNNPRDNWFGR